MINYKKKIIEFLKKELKEDITESILEVPPKQYLGDYALPCFFLSKKLKKSPNEIAKSLEKVKRPNFISKFEANGPYLNIFLKTEYLTKGILQQIQQKKDRYGSSNSGIGKKALIEHTSINPNASPHVGRARNAIIGDTITRLLKFEGYNVETHYFVNDIGKQIAMLVLAAKNKKSITFDNLLQIYVDFNKKLRSNPKLEKDVFSILHKLESGDQNTIKDFKKIVDICIKGQSKILSELDIKFDFFDFESKYLWDNTTQKILKMLEKTKKIFVDDEGRKVLNQDGNNLPMKSPFFVLTRADGTSLYPLRDLAYTIEKLNRSKDKNIIVLGEDHKLYSQQLKITLNLLGYGYPEVVHYSFILLQERDTKGKMSTREGKIVLLSDLMKEAVIKTKKELVKRKVKLSERELDKLAKEIGYGAIKFSILHISNDKNVIFDWDTSLNFEGDTGPYIQYTYVRAKAILEKVKQKTEEKLYTNTIYDEIEVELIKKLGYFPDIIKETIKDYKPHLLCNYLLDLSHTFNEFYHKCKVIDTENKDITNSRLQLVSCTSQVLSNGLSLLGIKVPSQM